MRALLPSRGHTGERRPLAGHQQVRGRVRHPHSKTEVKRLANSPTTGKDADNTLLAKVLEAVKSINYGTVQIVIHNSRIVQIEKTEKIRVKGAQDCVCS
ncbi:MAG: YezD family protein [Chloroflexota bacterium]